MFGSFKKRFAVIALMLVVFMLSGCLGGPKTFTVVVEIDPALAGVEIRKDSEDGDLLDTTGEDGKAEIENLKEGTKLFPVKDGYTFEPPFDTVTKDGAMPFTATPIEEEPEVREITDVEVLKVTLLVGELYVLPGTVTATLSDDEEVELDVDWDDDEFSSEKQDVFVIEGELVLPEGITNPDDLKAKIVLTVRFVPEEDEELYQDAANKVKEEVGEFDEPITEDIDLPAQVTVGEGDDAVTFAVAWRSDKPEILSDEGKILKRTAEDEVVTLTGTLSKQEPAAQEASDPRVVELTVTVAADPVKKAEALVEEIKAYEGPNHFNEVEGIQQRIQDAKDAVEAIEGNPMLSYELKMRIHGVEQAVGKILTDHVKAVLAAIDKSDLELFDALNAFWDADAEFKGTYWYMATKMGVLDIDSNSIKPEDVEIIQEELIEKAPQVYEERSIVELIVQAASEDDLLPFQGALQRYSDRFERLNLEDDDAQYSVLKAYRDEIRDAIGGESASIHTLEDIQLCIDAVNSTCFVNALENAFNSAEREDLDKAEVLFGYLPDDAPGTEHFAELMDDLDLLITVFDAETPAQLWEALHKEGLEFDFLYVELIEGYLEAIEEADRGGFTPGDSGESGESYEDRLNEIEGIIQAAIDGVNTENVKAILAEFSKVENDKDEHDDLLYGLLLKLEAATPIASGLTDPEDFDLDLADEELDFDPARMSYYRAALEEIESDVAEIVVKRDFEKVLNAIYDGNADYYGEFQKFTVEVTSAKLKEISFTIKAWNMKGEAYSGFDSATVTVDVFIDDDHREEEITATSDGQPGVWTVTTSESLKFDEITEGVVATLTIKVGQDEYTVTTDAFTVDADPTDLKVEADAEEYKSGHPISLTLTLEYGDAKKTVYTYNETSVVEVWFSTEEEAPVYNRQVTFVDGVGTLDVDAWKAESTVTVTVKLKLKDVDLQGDATITVKPGDPEILEATIDASSNDIELTLQDKFEQTVTWFEAENMEVQLAAVKDEGEEAGDVSGTSVTGASPGLDGVAFVSFVKGKATIEFAGSLYQTWLHEEYGAETDLELIITLVVDEKNLTAEVDYKVPSS